MLLETVMSMWIMVMIATLSILNSSNASSVVAAGALRMREMCPGVSSPPTMDTQYNQYSSQTLTVNPTFYALLSYQYVPTGSHIWISLQFIFRL